MHPESWCGLFCPAKKIAQLQQPLCYSPLRMNGPYHRAKNASRKNPRTFGSMQSITPESIRRQLQESVTIGELCNIKLKTKVQLNPLSQALFFNTCHSKKLKLKDKTQAKTQG